MISHPSADAAATSAPNDLNWDPFLIAESYKQAPRPRSLDVPGGLEDRMRSAAFAELQAIRAFRWAAEKFDDAPEALKQAWLEIADDEARHYQMIVRRMDELGLDIASRPVSLRLWESLQKCRSAEEFCVYIASAEERGRQAGIRLVEAIAETDPVTAKIFQQIVDEEIRHVEIARDFYQWTPETE